MPIANRLRQARLHSGGIVSTMHDLEGRVAKVFLSYDREDSERARSIAAALEKAGHSVWWDRHIKGGAQYSKEIEQALKRAEAVVVLWSAQSVDSAWVRDEAAAGRDSGRLVPVSLDRTEPPLGFRQYQTIDLSRRRFGRAQRDELLGAVTEVAEPDDRAPAARPSQKAAARASSIPWLAVGLALIAIAGALFFWRPWSNQREELVIAVAPGEAVASSQALARDLVVRLANVQTASSGAIRLVEASDRKAKAQLTFEATDVAGADNPAATMTLKSNEDSSILWSKEFAQPTGNRADLLQQIAYTAGRVSNCALEGRSARPGLASTTFKTYLNACALLSESGGVDPRQVIAMLVEVTEKSPKFLPAWSRLLFAESDAVSLAFNGGAQPVDERAELRRHIAAARKIDPDLPAATVAEALLLPPRDFFGRTTRIEQAAANGADDPALAQSLGSALAATGRLKEAVTAAGRAVRLDPLSPNAHSNYVSVLAYSGSFDAAERELRKAEKLWPGTASLTDAQFRYHLRYGEPRIARAIFDAQSEGGGHPFRLYLNARADPTPAKVETLIDYVGNRLAKMSNPSAGIGFATLAYGQFGRKEEVFRMLLAWPRPDDLGSIAEILFRPEFREVRRDPRFLLIAKRAGLLDYWLKSGQWPDYCFDNDQTYDCKAEAAKLVRAAR